MRGPGNGIGDRLQVTIRAARPRVESFQELPHLASHQQAFTTKIFGEKRRNVTEYSLGLMRAPLRDARRRRSAELQEEKLWGRASRKDRKSTRLNSSHGYISYAVFCLKKKTN